MADLSQSQSSVLAGASFDTALCIVPPRHLWPSIDNLRSRHDEAYRRWPPHSNLIYPFVQPDALPRALEIVQSAVQGFGSIPVRLDAVAHLSFHEKDVTFLYDSDSQRRQILADLRRSIQQALSDDKGHMNFRMRMTIGQSDDKSDFWRESLTQKARLLPTVEWEVDQLYILTRRKLAYSHLPNEMVPWAIITLNNDRITQKAAIQPFYHLPPGAVEENEHLCFTHNDNGIWQPCQPAHAPTPEHTDIPAIAVATYNVLAEFDYTPSPQRYPLIVRNLLSDPAKADIVVLQEVTDHFLSYLLQCQDVRDAFDFCSHGPPSQDDMEPLPSHNNVVVLSNHWFCWKNLPFDREHKSAIIANFDTLGYWDDSEWMPVVLAAIHLTHGLKNGAVSARRKEVEKLLACIGDKYAANPIIVAGDFNLTTSSFTIKEALEKKYITEQNAFYHRDIDRMLMSHGFVDTWTTFKLEKGLVSEDDLNSVCEDEQGATYDPTVNALARETVGSGFNMRPQRYDRILVRGCQFSVTHANQFGKTTEQIKRDDQEPKTLFASDHWGVRTIMKLSPEPYNQPPANAISCDSRHLKDLLADEEHIVTALQDVGAIPSTDESTARDKVFELLRIVLVDFSPPNAPIIVVPVGSYGLGVWTASSDIDCLCIGSISSNTFFSLAAQRLRKSSDKGIKILRWVKAQSGTMLEIDIQGTKVDVQYASAHTIAQNWRGVLRLPVSHSVWALSSQTLTKLKAIRDIDYITRSVPNIFKFRLAHRLIKTWAKRRGIYTAKYGYLGGIQIAILLARVYKMLARQDAMVTVSDVLGAFFNHYARFDWKTNIAFDPFFHKNLSYRRTDREPLAILGYFPPVLNTSLSASVPTVQTISEEFYRANQRLSEYGMTWSRFLDVYGSKDFLQSFKSFIRIDVQFWGGSLTKGRGFVGWVESRCVSLLVDLQKRLPDLYPRIWPARWMEKAGEDNGEAQEDDTGSYQGCYLIGLDKLKQDISVEDQTIMRATISSILSHFEAQIRADEHYFNEKISWMSASIVKATVLRYMEIDAREWGEFAIGDDEFDDELADQETGPSSSSWAAISEDDQQVATTVSSQLKKKDANITARTTNSPRSAMVPKPHDAGKFRTAADVLNRLRWDPFLDSGDYIVGYEDRFVGAMERGLEAWKSEQTDEEFIPQHRILYFKRKSDQTIVWERRTRTDLLFGSK